MIEFELSLGWDRLDDQPRAREYIARFVEMPDGAIEVTMLERPLPALSEGLSLALRRVCYAVPPPMHPTAALWHHFRDELEAHFKVTDLSTATLRLEARVQ